MTEAEITKAKAYFEYGIKCDIFSEPVLSYAKTVLEAFDDIKRKDAVIERLNKELDLSIENYKEAKAEAIKEFAERLCKDRVSNDPVVIAVKVELEMAGDTE